MGLGIKKGDTVRVVTGSERGKSGRVLSVQPKEQRVVIEKVNIIKKHMKPSKKYSQGGIIEKEAPLHLSNVMLQCPKCSKPARLGAFVPEGGGKKLRVCRKCGEVID